jgi:hypothetical protein
VRLVLKEEDSGLYGDAVEKRHGALATALGCKALLG